MAGDVSTSVSSEIEAGHLEHGCSTRTRVLGRALRRAEGERTGARGLRPKCGALTLRRARIGASREAPEGRLKHCRSPALFARDLVGWTDLARLAPDDLSAGKGEESKGERRLERETRR